MIWTCLRALLSHWRRSPLQLLAFIAGLALATGLWSGVQAINSEARASYAAASGTLGEGQYDSLVPRAGAAIPVETYVALRRAGWLVSPLVEARLGDVRVVGFDPLTAPQGMVQVEQMQQVEFASRVSGQLYATAETAAALNAGYSVAIDPAIAPGLAVGEIGDVLNALGLSTLTRLIVLPEQPLSRPELTEIAPELQLISASQTADIAQLTDSFHLNLTAFGLLSFVVGLFIVHSTIGLAFEQRRAVIRTMRALGVPLRTLIGVITLEMMSLAVIGAVLGIVLGYLVAALLLPDVAATLRGLYGAEVSGTLQLRSEWWLSGFLLAMGGAVLALAAGLWQIARMPLLASARPRAWVMAHGGALRWQVGLAVLSLLIAGALAFSADGLLAGFALLGSLLLGVALGFPVIAHTATRLAEAQAAKPLATWFWADTRQQLPGLSLALMALLLAVSANIGVATMVSSFRLTFLGFLDQRLAPELYIQVETREQGADLQAFLAARGLETLPLRATERSVNGQPARIIGVADVPTYRDNWVFLGAVEAPWDAVASGQGVIVNEQFARRGGLWVGDAVGLDRDLTLPIAAVVGDYGNPQAMLTVSEGVIARLDPASFAHQFGVRTADPDGLRAEIAQVLGLSPSAMINQRQLKDLSIDTFERTFLVTAALNVLTLGVAGFAILMSLLTLADMRIPQVAPVWALGITRARIAGLEFVRAGVLAALVFLCAVPVGLALAWVLLDIVNVAAFGWKLPMFTFPGEYATLGLYAICAAMFAALWPVLRLMRTPPATLLKVFSNER